MEKVIGLFLRPLQVFSLNERKYIIYFQHHVNAFVFLKNKHFKGFNDFSTSSNNKKRISFLLI
jgi:hypothetical protein